MSTEQPPQLVDLLKHRAFLERFALSLARDVGMAEDVVQETWLAAIERPPPHRANLRAWLRQVALRTFHRQRESRLATDAFESPAAEPVEEPRARVERESIARLLAAELLALPEPYRGVLTLRYYEDRTPSEIARALGRPVNTVTSQLARGLKLMQERLDRSRPGGRSEWVHALLALVPRTERSGGPRSSLARAPRVRHAPAWLAAAVVAAPVVTLVLLALSPEDAPLVASPDAPAPPTLDEGTPVPSRALDPVLPAAASGERAEVAADPPRPLGWVHVEVVDADGRPIQGAVVKTAWEQELPGSSETVIAFAERGLTDPSGRAEIPLTAEQRTRPVTDAADQLGVRAGAPGFAPSDVHYLPFPEGEAAALSIRLLPSVTVRGAVTDADGTPIEGAWVEISREGNQRLELGDDRYLFKMPGLAKTRADGRFECVDLPRRTLDVRIEGHGFLPHVASLETPESSTSTYDVVLYRGGSVAGRAETADGLPAQGTYVAVEFTPSGPRYALSSAMVDADGRFELVGVASGGVWLVASCKALSAATYVSLAEGERFTWNPVLRDVPALQLRVERGDGAPPIGSIVALEATDRSQTWRRFLSANARGRVRFHVAPEGELMASVFPSRHDAERGVPPCHTVTGLRAGPGETVLNVSRERLAVGALRGTLLDHEGETLPEAALHLRASGDRSFYRTPVAAETGAFQVDSLTTQSYELIARCAGLGTVRIEEIEMRAGETTDLGEIRLPRPIPWSPVWPDPLAPAADSYELAQVEPSLEQPWVIAAGAAPPPTSFAAFPGRYEWRLFRDGQRLETQVVDVR